ncbi:amphi-Trp domain-containing protein [Salinadaptatus halalkaliphilus]|uniref:Amphi-Trp domain-containing protein n=1 Tax=Salinadaptatus halalkaliphilus TaxID=2419781 RepID=A0A4S3TG46_9EURY|nr:amphi-Trp domain-containing protein [Salinadaptatus halalkaliphilus]THE62851.1 amphi-Trp domain-containing protein [Salinadaptatus halalkaliphilus]
MSDTTTHGEDLSREEVANRLQEIAHELHGDDPAEVQVGNKLLSLSPATVLEYAIEIEERSPMLGGDREEISVTIEWEVEQAESETQ